MTRGTKEAACTAKRDPATGKDRGSTQARSAARQDAAMQRAIPLPGLSQVSGAWVGASADVLEAFAALAETLPDGAGSAFVPTSHRNHFTRRYSACRPTLTASCVSGVSRNAFLAGSGGFMITEPAPKGWRLVMGIGSRLRSLADKRKNPAFGVSLSASGDGTPATTRNTG